MNDDARRENARMLAHLTGTSEDSAAELLQRNIAITCDPTDPVATAVAEDVRMLLIRTVSGCEINQREAGALAAELVLGLAPPRHSIPRLHASFDRGRMTVTATPRNHKQAAPHPLGRLIGACYLAGAVLKLALPGCIPHPSPTDWDLDLGDIMQATANQGPENVDFGEAYLAGAGAVGSAFVFALARLPMRGVLHIADHDAVSAGNLQRCLFFAEHHIGRNKAETLAREASVLLPHAVLIPHPGRLDTVPAKMSGPWLRRLIVGVDSPRARRQLQGEFPGEVFDASTTGVGEIVFHFHRQPTDRACLACAYAHSPDEHARERHIAAVLGVELDDVRQLSVSAAAACRVQERHPHLSADAIQGLAYDTLFKALCGSAPTLSPEGKQVLAPFAFVSTLAGALLAVEFYQRVMVGHEGRFNEWRISPWSAPLDRRKRIQPRHPGCEFCSNPVLRKFSHSFWSG